MVGETSPGFPVLSPESAADKLTTRQATGGTVLDIAHLSAGDPAERYTLRDVSLSVRGGEVVAIAGVAGNGQTLLAEAITGGLADYDGRIAIGGRDLRGLTRRQVARLGVGYVPENRTE